MSGKIPQADSVCAWQRGEVGGMGSREREGVFFQNYQRF